MAGQIIRGPRSRPRGQTPRAADVQCNFPQAVVLGVPALAYDLPSFKQPSDDASHRRAAIGYVDMRSSDTNPSPLTSASNGRDPWLARNNLHFIIRVQRTAASTACPLSSVKPQALVFLALPVFSSDSIHSRNSRPCTEQQATALENYSSLNAYRARGAGATASPAECRLLMSRTNPAPPVIHARRR